MVSGQALEAGGPGEGALKDHPAPGQEHEAARFASACLTTSGRMPCVAAALAGPPPA